MRSRKSPGYTAPCNEREGPERTKQLLFGLEQEARVQRDPNLKAEHVVQAWNALEKQRELAAMLETMRGKWHQWEWIAWTGIAAFFVGLLISPVLARVLPFG